MLGSDLVPDYLTRVEFGAFYGWPWNYWGGYEDKRVEPGRPDMREYTHLPDYGLGAQNAELGLTFAEGATMAAPLTNDSVIGLPGSWTRKSTAGYTVVFVKYPGKGLPHGLSLVMFTAFLNQEREHRRGPVVV